MEIALNYLIKFIITRKRCRLYGAWCGGLYGNDSHKHECAGQNDGAPCSYYASSLSFDCFD